MDATLVLAIVSADRPGIVNAVASVVTHHGGNWVDSSLTRLGGAFAGIARIEIDRDSVAALLTALEVLADEGVSVTAVQGGAMATPAGAPAHLSLTCSDHPGVVRRVSGVLTSLGVSFETLETRVFLGSMSGDHLFEAKAAIRLPPGLSPETLRAGLEEIARDLMADVDLDSPALQPV
jgi:glycine cleavage system regulatory protein